MAGFLFALDRGNIARFTGMHERIYWHFPSNLVCKADRVADRIARSLGWQEGREDRHRRQTIELLAG